LYIFEYQKDLEKQLNQSIALPLMASPGLSYILESSWDKSTIRELEKQKLDLKQLQLKQIQNERKPELKGGLNAMTIIGYQNYNNQDYYWDQSKWFGSVALSVSIPIPNKQISARLKLVGLEIKVQENIQAQWKWEWQKEMDYLINTQKTLQSELEQLSTQEAKWIIPAFNTWSTKLNQGETDFIQWSQSQNQWREFYELMLQKKVALMDNQIQISNLIGHE